MTFRHRTPEVARGKKYEYKSVKHYLGLRKKNREPDDKLNEAARKGWEYIGDHRIDGTTSRLIFQREV